MACCRLMADGDVWECIEFGGYRKNFTTEYTEKREDTENRKEVSLFSLFFFPLR